MLNLNNILVMKNLASTLKFEYFTKQFFKKFSNLFIKTLFQICQIAKFL